MTHPAAVRGGPSPTLRCHKNELQNLETYHVNDNHNLCSAFVRGRTNGDFNYNGNVCPRNNMHLLSSCNQRDDEGKKEGGTERKSKVCLSFIDSAPLTHDLLPFLALSVDLCLCWL